MNIDIMMYLQLAIILVVSITVHEFAHARSSDKLGDPTPRMMGRLTLNPMAHIDPLGFILIFIIRFGWGKPVQVNPSYYRQPLRDELLVAMAGPASNIVLACIGVIIMLILNQTTLGYINTGLIDFRQLFAVLNCGMAVFNMLPLPPLDGWRLVKMVVPQRATKMQILSHNKYTLIVMICLFLGWTHNVPIISDVMDRILSLIYQTSLGVYQLLHMIFAALFMIF